MEKLVREILAELATPPILVFPYWEAVTDGSCPFHVYCDACIDGLGAALEQEQGGRFHQTHGVYQPSYARLGKALDSS